MPTFTRTSALIALLAVGVTACGADKSATSLCPAWRSYRDERTFIETDGATPVSALAHAVSALKSVHELRVVADETTVDAVDEASTSLNSLVTALRHVDPASSTWRDDLDTEVQDEIDAFQQLDDLMVDECTN